MPLPSPPITPPSPQQALLQSLVSGARPAPLLDRRGQRLQLVVDTYRGDPQALPAGPLRHQDQLVAEVEWDDGRARVTCASLSAADRLKARLTRLGFEHQERQLDTSQLEPAPATGMLAFKTDFFQRWLDEPLEKLDGLSPRQAAGSQALRDLVRSLEAREQRLPPGERFDFNPLRQELGL